MKKLKTSKRISLKFTIFTMIVVFVFSVLINLVFLGSWIHTERAALQLPTPRHALKTPKTLAVNKASQRLREHFQDVMILDINDELAQEIISAEKDFGLFHHDDRWYLARGGREEVILRDVSVMVNKQIGLFHFTLILLFIFGGFSYFVSSWFVSRELRDLCHLGSYVNDLDIDNLKGEISFDHLPEDDEIQHVATAINQMGSKIHDQVNSIKQFMSYVSHEFKTPLMVMRTNSELALKSQQYEDGLKKNLDNIDTLNRLLDSMLLLTRAQSGKKLNTQTVSVRGVVDTYIEQLSAEEIDGIEFDVNGDANIDCHQGSIERIISNLCSNAIKYSPEGGEISIDIDEKGLVIADRGKGIGKLELDHIRDLFWQSDESRGHDAGFGLGLALVKSLVEMHGWTINVESEEGNGSKFVIDWT